MTSYVSRYGSSSTKTEPKDATSSSTERSSPIKRYGGAASKLNKYGRSRDPSPVALEHTNRGKSKSRDPSPVLESARSKLSGTAYRSGATRNTYGNRYGASGTSTGRLNGGSSTLDKSISYLTTSDFHARTASRAKASREKELEPEKVLEKDKEQQEGKLEQEQQQQQQTEGDPVEQETFISVAVVTRATSPTPPGSTTVQRTRRIDIAKTIEKTIQRSTRPRQMLEKEIQSDRLDDSTRYLRYSAGGAGSSTSNYSSPHRDRISSLRYSASPLSSSVKSSTPSSQSELPPVAEAVPSKSSTTSTTSSSTSRSSSSKSKLSPPKAVRLASSRQSSVENLANKPPAAPSKAESPTKTCVGSSASSSSLSKWPWPNKDFRKSSLNVGPTDRPRKSRTPSSGASESEEPNQQEEPSQQLERSPSEASVACSTRKAKLSNGSASKSSSSSSSRSLKAHKVCTASTGGSTGGSSTCTTSACSSSDSEQRVKTPSAKKPSKKKSTINGGQQKEKATKEDKAKGKVFKKEVEEQVQLEAEQVEGQPGVATQNSSQSATDSRSLALQRLSAVSNFLASRHHDANSEPIFLESSESAGEADSSMGAMNSLTLDTRTNESKQVASPTTTTTKPTTTTTTNPSFSGSSTQLPRESSTSSDCRSKSKQLTSETQQEQQQQHSLLEEPSWWQDTSLQINTASALDRGEMPYRLRHIDSGDEQAWWLRGGGGEQEDEDDTLAEESHNPLDDEQDVSAATTQQGWWSSEEKQQQNGHASLEQEQQQQEEQQEQAEEEEEEQQQTRHMPRSRISPEHVAWWLDEEQQREESQSSKQQQEQEQQPATDAHVEVTIKLPSSGSSSTRSKLAPSQSSDSNGHWWLSGPAKKLFNVQRVESGERAWWQEKEKENEPPAAVQAQAQAPPTPPPRIIKHWESGERAWWLQEEQAELVEAEVTSTLPPPGQDELDNQLSSSFNFSYSVRPPPLGQCASPVPPEQAQLAEAEQLLAEEQRKLCASPYDNIPMSKVQKSLSPPAAAQPAAQSPARFSCHYTPPPPARVGEKLFISRHQNIDELLGGACRPLSPLFLAAAASESSAAAAEPPAAKNMFLLEEITPDQVRIHDSTAQLPVIQRMQR